MMRVCLTALVLAGCASGRGSAEQTDGSVGVADAKEWRDGQIEGTPDAQTVVPPADAAPDAYQCQVQTRQLLLNPVLDLNPTGMGWVQQNVDNAYPIVTGDDGVPEHSPPFKAWLGGWDGESRGVTTVTDSLYQDVAIPASTTQLRLTGQYQVRTAEVVTTPYDTAQVALVQTNGTPIEVVKSMTNGTVAMTWTAIDHTFTAPMAGQNVRVRITTTNDYIDPTSFFFDTLSLTATICE